MTGGSYPPGCDSAAREAEDNRLSEPAPPCTNCAGAGYVWDGSLSSQEPCPECGGTGSAQAQQERAANPEAMETLRATLEATRPLTVGIDMASPGSDQTVFYCPLCQSPRNDCSPCWMTTCPFRDASPLPIARTITDDRLRATITINKPASAVQCAECSQMILDGDPAGHRPGCSAAVRIPMSVVVLQCEHPSGCVRHGIYNCDCCDRHFCSDHGSASGDSWTQPTRCWKCGGFDADGDPNVPEGEDEAVRIPRRP